MFGLSLTRNLRRYQKATDKLYHANAGRDLAADPLHRTEEERMMQLERLEVQLANTRREQHPHNKWRVATLQINPRALQARLRAIDPDCQVELMGTEMMVFTSRPPTQEMVKAILEAMPRGEAS